MASVSLQAIRKQYASGPEIIKGVDLEIRDGEFMVFVGPSGCGKSTLMRMIAGLEDISSGQLHIGGMLATQVPPAKRGVAMVFQSYALYPHMSVAQNMGFSLKMAGLTKSEIDAQVSTVADVLQITHLLDRKPSALSGGQRQRVAIGRAIVRQPSVFLFDEPLSNLDASLRVQMRLELTQLHKRLKSTMIYVTHDQTEAMTMGERITVFNQGVIEQVGSPLELYHQPANRFVASFMGSPKMNFLSARAERSDAGIALQLLEHAQMIVLSPQDASHWASLDTSRIASIGIRPEAVRLHPSEEVSTSSGAAPSASRLAAKIQWMERLGDISIAHLQLPGSDRAESFAVKILSDQQRWQTGQEVRLSMPACDMHCFDAQGQALRSGSK
jgi:multiple sugar transport system ATP-binding protein